MTSNVAGNRPGLPARLTIYGADWCPHVRRTRAMLDAGGQQYDFIDIDADRTARRHLQTLLRGVRRIPTVAFPDGRLLVEPTDVELLESLTTPPPRA